MRGGEILYLYPGWNNRSGIVHGAGIDHRFIGVRPVEKLHETMITEDDARYTVELDDRFVIQPSITFWKSTKPKYKGKHVAEDFRYSSDTNKHWLSEEALRNMPSES